MEKIKLCLENQISELHRIHTAIENLTELKKLKASTRRNLMLLAEEVFTNLVKYAFQDNNNHLIVFEICLLKSSIRLIFTDQGKAFDLREVKNNEPEKDLKQRKPGGMGIYLVKILSEDITYKTTGNKNILSITIRY